ncbi:MAG: ssDNA-binding protein [Pseudomonadota bacterium]
MADNDMIMLKGVRCSFAHLFTLPVINGEQQDKYSITLLLDPKGDADGIDALEALVETLSKERFKGRKLPSDKICLRDGDDTGRPENEGYKVIKASCKNNPLVLRGDGKTVITEEVDSPIYSGCYVNAKVRLWAQDNQHGKRINCELIAVQFAAEGEPLDGTYVSAETAMEGFDAANDDDDFLGGEAA